MLLVVLTLRYDSLLEHFDTAHATEASTYGVGMSISIE
jgi:hypothetical protein